MPKVDAWMPIYWGDYAKDTGHLGAIHHGAYLMLIKHYWVTGEALPADDSQLWRIACMDSLAQWRKVKPVVLAFFEERDARLVHERIEHELAKAEGNAERRQEMARRAANSRWGKGRGDAPRMPGAMPEGCSPPSSSDNSHGSISGDAPSAPAPNGARSGASGLTTDETWRQRLAGYDPHKRETWQPFWGPRPDAPGHQPLIPAELLRWWRAQVAQARSAAQ